MLEEVKRIDAEINGLAVLRWTMSFKAFNDEMNLLFERKRVALSGLKPYQRMDYLCHLPSNGLMVRRRSVMADAE